MTLAPRFDLKALRSLAGPRAFARGEAYHDDGRVTLIAIEPDRVVARVDGSAPYRVALAGVGDGTCTCPAFDDGAFCKHLVAAALAANAAPAAVEPPLARIRAHLEALPQGRLVELILDAAERDEALRQRLELAADATEEDPAALETRLRRAIDAATRVDDYIDYREVRDWVEGVESVLATLLHLAPGPAASVVAGLAEHALTRLDVAAECVDDSSGHVAGLREAARDAHLAACRAARPGSRALASTLFRFETEDWSDAFHAADALYADVLGPEGRAEYRRLAAAAWAAADPPRAAFAILDRFAAEAGDLEARIALRSRRLEDQYDYLALARFCRDHDRPVEALRHAEDALWRFADDPPDERLVRLADELLRAAGRDAEADELVWRAFAARPTLDLYRSLRARGGTAARDRAIDLLEAPRERSGLRRADLLLAILTAEGLHDRAWVLARATTAAPHARLALADASAASHPLEALAAYAEHVEALAATGGNHAYAEAAELVRRMAALRPPEEQAAYLAALRARHSRKRNFMKLLP